MSVIRLTPGTISLSISSHFPMMGKSIVVVAVNFDPIAKGFMQSLVRPGGNVTGIVSLQMELAAKQLELLTEAFPERKRVGALWDELSADQFRAAEREAQARQ
jgi:putative tryptophan/tyrosine transport system substrate-binding protein